MRNLLLKRAWCSASTGIVGLAKEAHPVETLQSLYSKILADIAEIPETAFYRKNVEAVTRNRLQLLSASSVAEFEKKVGVGLVEEVIQQARDEIGLIERMKEWKPWEQAAEPEVK